MQKIGLHTNQIPMLQFLRHNCSKSPFISVELEKEGDLSTPGYKEWKLNKCTA